MSHLNCPVCSSSFQEVIKEGIMIDICSQCKGVWLDRGELEKLISLARNDNSAGHGFANNQQTPNHRTQYQSDYSDQQRNHERRDHDRYDRRRRFDNDDDDYDDDDDGRRNGGFQRQSRFQRFFDIFD